MVKFMLLEASESFLNGLPNLRVSSPTNWLYNKDTCYFSNFCQFAFELLNPFSYINLIYLIIYLKKKGAVRLPFQVIEGPYGPSFQFFFF
jgi:hypothetical protein